MKASFKFIFLIICIIILFAGQLPAQTVVEKEKSGKVMLWLEAESGNIDSPMKVWDDGDASGGQYIEVISGNYSEENPPANGFATYNFSIKKPGIYKVWGRVIAAMSDEDAFWVRMDDQDWIQWKDIALGCEWHWDEVHDNRHDNQMMEFDLAAGSHQLIVTYFVDQTRLDKLLITNDLDFEPSDSGPRADARFNYNPETPVAKTDVRFDGTASFSTEGEIINYVWDFGNGNTVTGESVNYQFPAPGEYQVKLTVTDNSGLTGRQTKTVKVYTDEPVADYVYSPDHSRPDEVVNFDATGSLDANGEIVSYEWDFGDGSTATGVVQKHRFDAAGEYSVKLTVIDDEGKTASRERKLIVINPEPKKIIYETDMCLDVDDAGGLAMLHALANRGEVELLAVCFNEVHPDGAAAIDAINTWYGRGDLPVGIYKKDLSAPDYSEYLDDVAKFPHDLDNETAASALQVYRQVLSEQPDNSVTIVSVGFLNNLDDLLNAEPALVAQKVKELVIMGGVRNDGFNLSRHDLVSASQNVLENWGSPIVISQAGSSILTGPRLEETSESNPVREAYYKFFGSNFCPRPSWDQVAILYGVRGLADYFEKVTAGKGRLRNGYEWQMKPGYRSYLKTIHTSEHYARIIEELMVESPVK